MDVCVFSFFRPPATAGGCPSPFEPLMKGLRPEGLKRSVMTGESKPLLLSFKRGKPGGEGEGQYMPPPHRHRSTHSLKVTRPWAGIVRWVPHGAYSSGKCYGMRGICGNGGRAAGRGGTLHRLFPCLGRPQAEYGACPGTEPEADLGRVRPELE
jgi:hypothetical protein